MEAIRIKKTVNSETLQLPELKRWIGKDVEIILLVDSEPSASIESSPEEIKENWREKMTIRPRIKVSTEELIRPIEDIWEGYI